MLSDSASAERVLEIKCFRNTVSTYINLSRNRTANEKMKKATGLVDLDALYLSEHEIENLFNFALAM